MALLGHTLDSKVPLRTQTQTSRLILSASSTGRGHIDLVLSGTSTPTRHNVMPHRSEEILGRARKLTGESREHPYG